MRNNKINVILATDSNYAQHAAVAMASVLINTVKPEQVQFYLIDDNINAVAKDKIRHTVEKFGSGVEFLQVDDANLDNVFVSGNLTKAAYLRLYISHILPADVHKVIYLDCDLLVLDDIAKMWNLDMQGKPVAAAEDFGILASSDKRKEKEKNLGWKMEYSYFNSGVLMIDVEAWREYGYSEQLVKLIQERHFRHHDQDALNYLFMNNWLHLPLRWNVIPPVFNMPLQVALQTDLRKKAVAAMGDMGIMHYAGGYKPWEYKIYAGFNDKYYEYLAQTDYKDAKLPQPNLKKKGHSISRQLWRMKWARMIAKL